MMDPRLEQRRQRVAEDRARSNLARLMRVLMLLGVMAFIVWLLQSPFLSVSNIEVSGATEVDAHQVLATTGVVEGKPMVLLDIDAAVAAIEDSPWVIDAEVARDWPTGVVVTVEERVAVATLRLSDGWHLVSADGMTLTRPDAQVDGLPAGQLEALSTTSERDRLTIGGAAEFLAGIGSHLVDKTTLRLSSEGLEAVMAGFVIRLGGPFEMGEKASVATAMVGSDLEPGSIITLVAPASPAVLPPGNPEEPTDTTDSGGSDDSSGDGDG